MPSTLASTALFLHFDKGYSYAQVADALTATFGKPVSRCAVAGLVYRHREGPRKRAQAVGKYDPILRLACEEGLTLTQAAKRAGCRVQYAWGRSRVLGLQFRDGRVS